VDREQIQRRDFPTGRRGYDPAAVDEHLRRVADEFQTRAHTPPPTLSGATSEQVRQILQAAERSVSEMQARASEEASDHVARVQEAADGMLAKLDDLESELGDLLTALRASGERLIAGLAELQAEVGRGELRGEEATVGDASADPSEEEEDFAGAGVGGDGVGGSDEAGARLIALNMALSGSSREETARYLADHFALAEPDALLDDVFARAGR
jgi:DivIVA domain-containing protein